MEKGTERKLLLETDSDKDINTNMDTMTNRRHDFAAASGTQIHIWSRPQDTWNSDSVHPFTEGPSGLTIQEMPHVNKDSTLRIVFFLFSRKVRQLLVVLTAGNQINETAVFVLPLEARK